MQQRNTFGLYMQFVTCTYPIFVDILAAYTPVQNTGIRYNFYKLCTRCVAIFAICISFLEKRKSLVKNSRDILALLALNLDSHRPGGFRWSFMICCYYRYTTFYIKIWFSKWPMKRHLNSRALTHYVCIRVCVAKIYQAVKSSRKWMPVNQNVFIMFSRINSGIFYN